MAKSKADRMMDAKEALIQVLSEAGATDHGEQRDGCVFAEYPGGQRRVFELTWRKILDSPRQERIGIRERHPLAQIAYVTLPRDRDHLLRQIRKVDSHAGTESPV